MSWTGNLRCGQREKGISQQGYVLTECVDSGSLKHYFLTFSLYTDPSLKNMEMLILLHFQKVRHAIKNKKFIDKERCSVLSLI